MSYPAYDNGGIAGPNYNNQVGFPISRRPSMYSHPSEYGFDPAIPSGPYSDRYAKPGYAGPGSTVFPAYTPSRQMSQYNPAYDDYNNNGRDFYYDEPPAAAGYATPWTPGMSRRRRRSSVASTRSRPMMDSYNMRMSGVLIKFRRKGGFRSGISLGEAMANVRLSGNDDYTFNELNVDGRGRIILKIRWSGYTSMTYEIPVDGYEGRVQLQTLARRIARACVHFLQANMIPISWDRVFLYHLEEISIGVWQPVLSTS